jgi:hypothetical protein
MEYKQFVVKAFEREPGKWRASVERANGKVLLRALARRRRALDKFITGMDATAAEAAMQMAMAAIDANAFSRVSSRDTRQARTAPKDIETRSERATAGSRVDVFGVADLRTRQAVRRKGSCPRHAREAAG